MCSTTMSPSAGPPGRRRNWPLKMMPGVCDARQDGGVRGDPRDRRQLREGPPERAMAVDRSEGAGGEQLDPVVEVSDVALDTADHDGDPLRRCLDRMQG